MLGRRRDRLRQRLDDDRVRVIGRGIGLVARHRLRIGQITQTGFRVVEHVPGIGTPGLDRFHVVLDRDDRIGEAIDGFGRQRKAIRAHELRECAIDAFHDLGSARLVEHREPRLDASHQRRNLIDALTFARLVHRLRDGFLDARHVDDAFAQHRFGDLAKFDVVGTDRFGRRLRLCRGHDHADELFIQAVFDLDQRRGHAQQRAFIDRRLLHDDGLQIRGFTLHLVAQVAQTQHTERIGNLFQQLELRRELIDLSATTTHENIERVFHPAQVFLDGRRNGLHQLDRRRRKTFACLFDRIVDRQQFVQAERCAYGGDTRTGRLRACNVVEKIV